jgi:uncharacterized protein (TIGR04255 family)
MKIKQSDPKRVVYKHNPLVEVLCQIRVERVLRLDTGAPDAFQQKFAAKYPKLIEEQVASFQVVVGPGQPGAVDQLPTPAAAKIYHFISADERTKVSVSADFVSFSCEVYERWESFKEQALEAFFGFLEIYPEAAPARIGLRYKDLIVRENLGLQGTPWSQLLTPFVSGVFAVEDFLEEPLTVADEARIQQASQATLRLDECGLLVQSTMLRSAYAEPQTAFLIDSDFFRDSSSYDLRPGKTSENLEALHGNAYALFRRCITETLHNALGPTPI